jgi:RNA recognition motif-containing protein
MLNLFKAKKINSLYLKPIILYYSSHNKFCNLTLFNSKELAIKEPEDYRKVFIENLPTDWKDEDIRVRLEQLGKIEKLHIIKNSIGQKTGRVLAIYEKIENLADAIKNFKDKMPFFKPVKIRFFREFKTKKINPDYLNDEYDLKSEVLLIKNIPSDLLMQDLKLFLSEFQEPVHISYLKNEKNEFKRVALVYFNTIQEAEKVLQYANLRYVKDKQLFFQFSFNHWDLTDFRTRIEMGVTLPAPVELKLFQKQIENYKYILASAGEYTEEDKEKIEYLEMRRRKLEHKVQYLGYDLGKLEQASSNIRIEGKKKNTKYQISSDKGMIFADKKTLI